MFRTVSAARVDFVALWGKNQLVLVPAYERVGKVCLTLILRALHRLQPALDFLWDRRGGMAGGLEKKVGFAADRTGLFRLRCGLVIFHIMASDGGKSAGSFTR